MMIIGCIILFEIISDNHKSRFILIIEVLYSFSLVLLNLLLLLKYDYLAGDEVLENDIEIITSLVVYLMAGLLVIRLLMEIKEIIVSLMILVVCKDKTAKVSPENKA